MKKTIITLFCVIAACCIFSTTGLAGQGAQSGDRDGTPDRDRLRDGSCQDLLQGDDDIFILVSSSQGTGDRDGTPDRDQDRLRDGSCPKGQPVEKNAVKLVGNGQRQGDRDGTPDRDRLRDGSCNAV